MNYSTLLTEVKNGTCLVTINRPDKLNALNKQVFTDLENVIDYINSDSEIKSAVLTGAGDKAFVAGADISEFASLNRKEAEELSRRGQMIFFKIENSSKPIIAAVNGFALGGGCELAMACHFRLCSTNAKFGQPEVNLGLIPGYGGTQRLTKLIGKGKSMELHMTGNFMNAEEAYHYHLVNYVTEPEELLNKAFELIKSIHSKAPVAISKVIHAINAAETENGNNGFEIEINGFGDCFETEDLKEGASAFMEKRKPVFKGK